MIFATHCKVCKETVSVDIDDEYLALRDTLGMDPHKLIPMATCKRCYRLRCERDDCHEKIKKGCELLLDVWGNPGKQATVRATLKPVIERITKRYAAVIAEFRRSPVVYHDPGLVDVLLDDPAAWHQTLEQFREQCRMKIKQANLQTMEQQLTDTNETGPK